ncbi:nodulation-signaling pathway 2 protein-like [Fagus crenata]
MFSSDHFVTTIEDSSELSSTMFPADIVPQGTCYDSQQVMSTMMDFSFELEGLEPNLNYKIEGMCGILGDSEGSFPDLWKLCTLGMIFPVKEVFLFEHLRSEGEDSLSPSMSMKSDSSLTDVASLQSSLTLPGEDMEIDNQVSLYHLLKAYGEVLENDQRELGQVILRRISEKVSPIGKTLERLAFYLSQDMNYQVDYLKQESLKNFKTAFQALYQALPTGKFAHCAANSSILEAMPDDAETIHIVDFDMGEGVQWPPMIEAIANQNKTLKLTSIRWEEEDCDCPPLWRFEETQRRLYDQARAFGLKLKVEEIGIDDLVSEIKKMKKRDGRRE